jgi:hypothetical protein
VKHADATDGEEMTIRQLEDWLPLLEMFAADHSVLQGAAGEDAMNVGDIIKIVRSHILCRAVTDICCKRRSTASETAMLEDVPFDAADAYTRRRRQRSGRSRQDREHYDVDSANAAFLIFDDCRQRGQDEREAFMRAIPRLIKATPSATPMPERVLVVDDAISIRGAALEKMIAESERVVEPHADKHSTPKAVALRCAEIVREYARRDDIDHDSVPGVWRAARSTLPEERAIELLLRRATVYIEAKHMHIVTTMPEGSPVKHPCAACDLLAEIREALVSPLAMPTKDG